MPSTTSSWVSSVFDFFNGDDAVLADLLHGLGNDLADGLVVVGGDGADLSDHGRPGNWLGELVEFAGLAAVAGLLVEVRRRWRSTAFSMPRFRAIGLAPAATVFTPSRIDGLGQNGGGGGAVAGDVGGLGGDFAHHLRAHVFLRVLQFDFLGYGDAVLGDGRRTEFLFDDNVAALGAERDFHGVGENVDAAENRLPGLFSVNNLLCHNCLLL